MARGNYWLHRRKSTPEGMKWKAEQMAKAAATRKAASIAKMQHLGVDISILAQTEAARYAPPPVWAPSALDKTR
jgi:hypothetical protein